MSHVRTSSYYPQSNGKIERWHQSLKRECIRPGTLLDLDDARRLVEEFADYYIMERLHSTIVYIYIAPECKPEGREQEIVADRDRKLVVARRDQKLPKLLTIYNPIFLKRLQWRRNRKDLVTVRARQPQLMNMDI